ncbi:protein-(glutamine-N5) methyltransferase, release factor-specific [Leptothrix cholodnii SP-6]|uniref:Release factor glutamine methyltransferase n=1 Tax=Leptothrix cholodnii (strain ATCC 51168 / LMG 8142 / SP-6) TaxID=395495 RepID=B1XYX0_LEPCP|nr:peptide chain release factor N(5)-glutamine methyltransferase [Leptothrix cholodnii]ACB32854.1 protein-(glutamine-N5) methyltransferase, release factor-specific [Leptothrix cholodnii SP-6]
MTSPAPTIGQALAQARDAGLARLDAQLLLGHVCGLSRTGLLTNDDQVLPAAQLARWQQLLARRLAGEPVAYLTGRHEFHGLTLHITSDVLDPRPDTETLVDWGLELLARLGRPARVLDLGTGSGAIALAIKHRCPSAQVSAVDFSAAALAVARANGARLNLDVDWQPGNWFENLAGQRFDLILSNPPYIAEDDPHMPALRHEPRQALVSGADGLDDIRSLVRQAPQHLVAGGWLLLEHGHDQGVAVQDLLRSTGYREVDRRLDLADHVRCSGGQWPAAGN